jgi:hypothetical protein
LHLFFHLTLYQTNPSQVQLITILLHTMPVTRAAAARNTPVDVGDTHPKPVPKRQRKTARVKAKTTAALPTGSGNAAVTSAPLSPDSNDSTRAAHAQNLAPPPSCLPRKVSTTYSARISNPSDINRPAPRLLGRGEGDPDPDPDAAFISTRVRWGRDDRGAPQTPVPESPLNMDVSPSHHVACSPPWVEDQDMQNNDTDCGTPLYFPSSPPNANNHETPLSFPQSPANSGEHTPKSRLSSPSGSDYSERRKDDERMRQQKIRLRGPAAVTPTQEEQDEEDDRMLDQEAPVSPPQFTAAQKGKGKASSRRPLRHDEDDADNLSDHNTSERRLFRSGPVQAAAKAQVIEARRIYHETVAAIAREEGKPVDLLFNIVGENRVKPRRINVWNAFQSWYPEHGEIKCEDYSTHTFFSVFLRVLTLLQCLAQNTPASFVKSTTRSSLSLVTRPTTQ